MVNEHVSSMWMCANTWYGPCICDIGVPEQGVGAVSGECCLYCACPVQCFCVTNMFVLCFRWGGRGRRSEEEEEKKASQKV